MKINAPGIYLDFDMAAYMADPCPMPSLNQTIAKVLCEQSPAHAWQQHPALGGRIEESEDYDSAKAIGNAAHALLLGRGREIAEGQFDNWRTKEAQTFKGAKLVEGKIVILSKHLTRAVDMVKAARAQLDDAGHTSAFRDGSAEVVIAWEESGIWFRTAIDWMCGPLAVYDLKTGGLSVAPHLVAERPSEQGWDVQAAMHERALDAVDPGNAGRRLFHYICQENEPPYALTPVRISEADLTMGRKKLAYAAEVWRQCVSTGKWPAYPSETVLSRPRGYLEQRWLERETEHAERLARPREPMLDTLMGG